MTIAFRKPAGAIADVNELEYISALHQTDLAEVREDGSIDANDIRLFLLSRYGIEVTEADVRTKIIRGLGGGNEEEDDRLDLMEVAAMLMIPTLRKAAATDDGEDVEVLKEGVVKPRAGLVDFVLRMMLHDCAGSSTEPRKLTRALVKRILRSYGENELASNDDIVEEMLLAATSGDEGGADSGLFDGRTFARALTQDVHMYGLANEVRVSTIHEDVFHTKNLGDTEERDAQVEGISREVVTESSKLGNQLKTRFTFSSIDNTAGTHRSQALLVLLWASWALTYSVYYHTMLQNSTSGNCDDSPYVHGASWQRNSEAIGCSISTSILRWFVLFVFITIYGVTYIGLGSIGNYVTCRRWFVPLIGAAFAGFAVMSPFDAFGHGYTTYLSIMAVVLGLGVVVFHCLHALSLLVSKTWAQANPRWEHRLTTGSVKDANIKRAAAHKVNLMMRNAIDIAENKSQQGVVVSHFGQGLLNFSKSTNHAVAGGFCWTWASIYNGELFNREGIWLSTRLLSSNIAQFIVSAFILTTGINFTKNASANYDEDDARAVAGEYINIMFDRSIDAGLTESLVSNITTEFASFLSDSNTTDALGTQCNASIGFGDLSSLGESACSLAGDFYNCSSVTRTDYLCALAEQAVEGNATLPGGLEDGLVNLGLLNASELNVDLILNATRQALIASAESSVDSLYPDEKYMVVAPLAVGTVIAFIAAILLAVTYIPSATATTLKLRSGVIPTLRDPEFHKYRIAADQVTVLLGSLFWGCLLAAVLLGGFFGFIVFVFVWQATKGLVQRFVGWLMGLIVINLLRLLLVWMCRCVCYKAFYRRRPLSANVASLALECAMFALSVWLVLVRVVKLLFTAILYVGRIDSFFLAPRVGELQLGKVDIKLDNYPFIFMKDILIHEAHRHPYIELLGCMYLLKLRYGDNFGNRGGSTWRLLFVYALLPWMHQYRLACRSSEDKEGGSRTFRRRSTAKKLQCVDLHHGYDLEEAPAQVVAPHRQSLLLSQALPVSVMNLAAEESQLQIRNEELEDDVKELREQVERLQAVLRESHITKLDESGMTLIDNSLESEAAFGVCKKDQEDDLMMTSAPAVTAEEASSAGNGESDVI